MTYKHLLIDVSTLAYCFLFNEKQTVQESDVSVIKFFILKHLFQLIEQFNPHKMFLCFDSPKPWRKNLYPFYKENRKKIREKNSLEQGGFVDWKLFFSVLDDFYLEVKENFPFFTYKIPSIEADDIIYFLVKYVLPQEDEKIVITKDNDFIQLLINNKNIKIYDSFVQKYIQHSNPYFYLQQKICMGDKSDNIPPIKQRMGEKTSEAFIKNNGLQKLLEEENKYFQIYQAYKSEEMNNYIRNKKLIDFSEIPQHILSEIEQHIKNYKQPNKCFNYFHYFIKQKYRIFIEDISKIRNKLETVQKHFVN